jgi:hypothetical protein
MTTNLLNAGVEPPPETSRISNIPQTTDNLQQYSYDETTLVTNIYRMKYGSNLFEYRKL